MNAVGSPFTISVPSSFKIATVSPLTGALSLTVITNFVRSYKQWYSCRLTFLGLLDVILEDCYVIYDWLELIPRRK